MNARIRTLVSSIVLGTIAALSFSATSGLAGESAGARLDGATGDTGCALAGAAGPAGCTDWRGFAYGDEDGHLGVLAMYTPGGERVTLRAVRLRGPRVAWVPADYPTREGTVTWRVTVWTSPTQDGPWTRVSRTSLRRLTADRVGARERFAARTVPVPEVAQARFVRIASRLTWLSEAGAAILHDDHRYGRYGLIVTSDDSPTFGDQDATRERSAPTRWRVD